MREALRADFDPPVVITGLPLGCARLAWRHRQVGAGQCPGLRSQEREASPDGVVWVGVELLPTVADLQRRVDNDLGGTGMAKAELR